MVKHWREVFDKHEESPHHNASTDVPDKEALYARAQKAKEGTSGGSDGWLPRN